MINTVMTIWSYYLSEIYVNEIITPTNKHNLQHNNYTCTHYEYFWQSILVAIYVHNI